MPAESPRLCQYGRSYLLTPPSTPALSAPSINNLPTLITCNLSLETIAAPAENSGAVEYGIVFWHGEDEQGRERFLAFTIITKSTFRLLSYEPVEDSDNNAFKITEIIPATQTPTIHLDTTPNKIPR